MVKVHEKNCFSLLFKERSYDFECESEQIRNKYVENLKLLIKSTNKF